MICIHTCVLLYYYYHTCKLLTQSHLVTLYLLNWVCVIIQVYCGSLNVVWWFTLQPITLHYSMLCYVTLRVHFLKVPKQVQWTECKVDIWISSFIQVTISITEHTTVRASTTLTTNWYLVATWHMTHGSHCSHHTMWVGHTWASCEPHPHSLFRGRVGHTTTQSAQL